MRRHNVSRARELRQAMTPAELRLWQALRANVFEHGRFVRQMPIGPYIADFVCRRARLVVEVDGGQHADSRHDQFRDAWIKERGYRVLRFWNNEVLSNTEGVIETIMAALAENAPSPQPSPRWGDGAKSGTRQPSTLPHEERSGSSYLSPTGRGRDVERSETARVRGKFTDNLSETPPHPNPLSGGEREKTLRTLDDLVASGAVDAAQAAALKPVVERFQVAVTPAMLGLMARDESGAVAQGDAIAAQFVPDPREASVAPEELADPIGDEAHRPLPGLIHRYEDRVLVQPTHVCAVYCRFCFRRETVGPENGTLGEDQLRTIWDYIAARPQIFEVILSGGDPLVLSPRRLRAMVEAIAAIDHVKVIRLHSRVPAVDPARITPELAQVLKWRGATYVVLHVNHARELTPMALQACALLVDAGIPMLSQSVLLKGVNDDAGTLEQLFRVLVANRIKPYYLHHGDLAQGTGHFRTSIVHGQSLMRDLRGRLTGIAQPSYVLDIPGGHGKAPVGPSYVHACEGGLEIEDPQGNRHPYPPRF